MSLEARRIVDEFGHYVGVAVVRNLDLYVTKFAVEQHSVIADVVAPALPKPKCVIVRQWLDYDEEYAFGVAEGFIEGMETRQPGDPEQITHFGISSGGHF